MAGRSSPLRARPTRFRGLATLAACIALTIAAALADRAIPEPPPPVSSSSRDVDLFKAVVTDLRAGEPYYDAFGRELRLRGYPAASVFNWRTPLVFSVLSSVPPFVSRAALTVLGMAMLLCAVSAAAARRSLAALLAATAELGAVVVVFVPDATLLPEAWAGVLMGLSLCAYEKQRWRTAASVVVVALFLRELVAPYAVLCGLLSLRHRRWSELAVWILGAIGYGLFFVWHVQHVNGARLTTDVAHQHSWLYGGGLPFVLSTLRVNAWLLIAPAWTASVMLGLLMAAWMRPASAHLRAALLYVALFAAVGQPFNFYWGLIVAPCCALAIGDGVQAIREAVMAMRSPTRELVPRGFS